MQAICIAANNASAAPLRALWEFVGRWETSPSMIAMHYPPHITLAIYEDVDSSTLADVAHAIFAGRSALRVRFEAISSFSASPLILWAKPADTAELEGLHRSVHEQIEPQLCHDHYRPANWVPHCTLGTAVTDENFDAAQALIEQPLEPFEVFFDAADCVTFPPVEVQQRINLK